jgi:hypothetical protein
MYRLIVFFLFLVKHAVFSNLIDIGYTESRRHHTLPVCWMFLCYQILLETIGTLFLLGLITLCTWSEPHHLWRWESFIMAEALGMMLTWFVEKQASYSNLFLSHVLAELSFLGLYAIFILALYPF